MTFDKKLFGERLRTAIQTRHGEHGLSVATRLLNQAGMDKFTLIRMSEYVNGVKVPTLERFTLMVMVLELDVTLVFPGWGQNVTQHPAKIRRPLEQQVPKVRAIRHPSEKTT